jgi:ABC-type transport system involved in multi-copper enzyme maturation permease subunit
MQALRNIGIIGRITMLEGARKQVFHVLLMVAVVMIFGSTVLAHFDDKVQAKMLADLSLASMFFVSAAIAITITVTGVPGEMEQKTVYPVLAKAVTRSQFVLGKFAGAMGTVAIGMAVMALAFVFVEWWFLAGHIDFAVLYVVPFLFLETAILAAISLALSTVCSWPLAWFLSVIVCLVGNVKFQLYASLMAKHPTPFNKAAISGFYHVLPSLESFNFKDALVHHLTVPNVYLWQTALYGLCYTAAMLTLASISFRRREL